FQAPTLSELPYSGTSTSTTLVAGDFSGDGRLDLVLGRSTEIVNAAHELKYSGIVTILLGQGDGTFQPPLSYTVGQYVFSLVTDDFNGDGRLDLALANGQGYLANGDNSNPYQTYGILSVLLGKGDGTFQAPVQSIVGTACSMVVTGDFNSDGQ